MTKEQKFKELSSGLTRKIDLNRWPSEIHFFNSTGWAFSYDIISGFLWVRYNPIWMVLAGMNDDNYTMCQSFIKKQVEEHFKSKEVTPIDTFSPRSGRVEEHFKSKEVTPLGRQILQPYEVEEHFKRGAIQGEEDTLTALMPIGCFYDDNEMPHHVEIPALWFSNGEAYCYYRGVYLETELFIKLKNNTVTFEEWAAQDNEEVKSAILAYLEEVHGSEAAYRLISSHLKEVDTYVDKKEGKYLVGTTGGMNIGVYTLFKGIINARLGENKEIELAYIRCYCPSTDRMFFLGVHPKYNKAKDAVASLYKFPNKLIPHIECINRQGERFSTILNEEGKRLRKKLTPDDISDRGTISGDKYFSLMRYEY
jgi:hypothetical protein